jgi:hypothetical protein
LTSDPETSIIFTNDNDMSDAIQAHESLTRAKKKPVFFRKYGATRPTLLQTEPVQGDFNSGLDITPTSWLESLEKVEKIAGSLTHHALKAGIKISTTRLLRPTESRVRRCFAFLLEYRKQHPAAPLLIEVFWGMILAPKTNSSPSNFNKTVNDRCKLFEEGQWDTLWQQIKYKNSTNTTTQQQNANSDTKTKDELLNRKAKKAQDHVTNNKSVAAAMKTIRSPIIENISGSLLNTFKKLHPQVGEPIDIPNKPDLSHARQDFTRLNNFEISHYFVRRPIIDPSFKTSQPTTNPIKFKVEDFMGKIRRGDESTAGGLNGMNYTILKIIFQNNDLLARTYSDYLNEVLGGNASEDERDLLNASRGVGLPKNEAGDIRPIAVGHILLRMLGSMALKSKAAEIQKFFMPIQFGVGVRSGCELMINAISAHLSIHPNHILVSCDSKNAFNSFDRSKIWGPLRTHFPSLEPFVRLAYMEPGKVIFTENGEIESVTQCRIQTRLLDGILPLLSSNS